MKCSKCGYLAIGVTGKCPKCGKELPPPLEDNAELSLSRSATENALTKADNSEEVSATEMPEPKQEIDTEIAEQANLFAMETQDFDDLLGTGRSTPPMHIPTETEQASATSVSNEDTATENITSVESATDIDIDPPTDESTTLAGSPDTEPPEEDETETAPTSEFFNTAQTSETLPAQNSETVSRTSEETTSDEHSTDDNRKSTTNHAPAFEDSTTTEENNQNADATDSFVFDFGDDLTTSSTSSRRKQAALPDPTATGKTATATQRQKPDIEYFVRRVSAFALDTFLFSLIIALFAVTVVLSGDIIDTNTVQNSELLKTIAFSVAIPFFFTVLIVSLCYNVVFIAAFGKTPGKIAFGLKITDANGAPLTPTTAFIRWIGYLAGISTLGAGFAWAFFDQENRALHDRMADSRVVRAEEDDGASLL
jgi:uncharacterized RDD family membrane protein YckC